MSLIYIINMELLNKIIFYLLNKLNITESNTILSEEESKKLFIEILSKIKYEENNITFNLINKNYERYYSKIFFLENIQGIKLKKLDIIIFFLIFIKIQILSKLMIILIRLLIILLIL